MEPANNGGLGASGAVVLTTAIVAVVVMIMVEIGGGLTGAVRVATRGDGAGHNDAGGAESGLNC